MTIEKPGMSRRHLLRTAAISVQQARKPISNATIRNFYSKRCLRQIWDNGNVCVKLRWIRSKRKQAIFIANRIARPFSDDACMKTGCTKLFCMVKFAFNNSAV